MFALSKREAVSNDNPSCGSESFENQCGTGRVLRRRVRRGGAVWTFALWNGAQWNGAFRFASHTLLCWHAPIFDLNGNDGLTMVSVSNLRVDRPTRNCAETTRTRNARYQPHFEKMTAFTSAAKAIAVTQIIVSDMRIPSTSRNRTALTIKPIKPAMAAMACNIRRRRLRFMRASIWLNFE